LGTLTPASAARLTASSMRFAHGFEKIKVLRLCTKFFWKILAERFNSFDESRS